MKPVVPPAVPYLAVRRQRCCGAKRQGQCSRRFPQVTPVRGHRIYQPQGGCGARDGGMVILDLANLLKKLMEGTFEIIWDVTKANGQPRRIVELIVSNTPEALRYDVVVTVPFPTHTCYQAQFIQ